MLCLPAELALLLLLRTNPSPQDTEVLELQQQLQQLQQQDEQLEAAQRDAEATERAQAAAFAAANKAAAAAYQQQAEAEAAAERMSGVEVSKPVVARAPPAAPADLFKIDLSLLDSDIPGHQQLMQVLMGFRQDMVEGLTGVTSTMMVSAVCSYTLQPIGKHAASWRRAVLLGWIMWRVKSQLPGGICVTVFTPTSTSTLGLCIIWYLLPQRSLSAALAVQLMRSAVQRSALHLCVSCVWELITTCSSRPHAAAVALFCCCTGDPRGPGPCAAADVTHRHRALSGPSRPCR